MAQDGMALLALIPLVGTVVGMYNWADSLWLLWDKPNRQCLHDKFGRTAVVKLAAADLAARGGTAPAPEAVGALSPFATAGAGAPPAGGPTERSEAGA
jgi:hypothetical protein